MSYTLRTYATRRITIVAVYRVQATSQQLYSHELDEQAVLASPEAREIITNEGTATFVVHSTSKIVAEPNPGSSLAVDAFENTFLHHADGTNIVETGDPAKPYAIPLEHIKGYFDLDSGSGQAEFVANPAFVALGRTALEQ